MIVLLILAILAAFALPKFAAMNTRAIDANEESVIGALTEAISNEQIANGEPLHISSNVFITLSVSPPYEDLGYQSSGFVPFPPDGKKLEDVAGIRHAWRAKSDDSMSSL